MAEGETGRGPGSSVLDALPTDRLREEGERLLSALAQRATGAVGDLTTRLTDYAENGGSGGLAAAVTGGKALSEGSSPVGAGVKAALGGVKEKIGQALGGGGAGGGSDVKVTNIVEQIDVGVPRRVAYDQWTLFEDFPSFMKKVESVQQESEEKLTWKAQIVWSHRTWNATIIEQVPDERIVWRSEGQKGHVDGAVTFHELAPNLTRILLVLEYHPQGFFERTGNIWRAQGRRARLELKHFRRYVMTETILHPDDVEGWRGEIRDSEVVSSGEAEDAGRSDVDEAEGDADEDDAGYEPDGDDVDEPDEDLGESDEEDAGEDDADEDEPEEDLDQEYDEEDDQEFDEEYDEPDTRAGSGRR